jgi:serine/threonine protein kinase
VSDVVEQGVLIGTIVEGRYRIDEEVGRGGFATVWKAYHLRLGISVAFKQLRLPLALEADKRAQALAQFVEEARVLTRIRHENVVRTYDQGFLDGLPYLVLEWCEHGSMRDLLGQRAGVPLTLAEAWELLSPIVLAVGQAHDVGVVHRDLKPANIMLVRDGPRWVPRVIDFGIAKLCDPAEHAGSGATQTRSGSSAFTPAYAAPEQMAGARSGPWTDIHALGLMFVELVTGQDPYPATSLIRSVLDAERPSAARHGIDVGPFEPVIAKALALRPADRFASIAEFHLRLTEAAKSSGVGAGATPETSLLRLEQNKPTPLPSHHSAAFRSTVPSGQPSRVGSVVLHDTVPATARSEPSRRRAFIRAGLGVGALALTGAGLLVMRPKPPREAIATAKATPVALLTNEVIEQALLKYNIKHVRSLPGAAGLLSVHFFHEQKGGLIEAIELPSQSAEREQQLKLTVQTWSGQYGLAVGCVIDGGRALLLGWKRGAVAEGLLDALVRLSQPADFRSYFSEPFSQAPAVTPNTLIEVSPSCLRARLSDLGAQLSDDEPGSPYDLRLRFGGQNGQLRVFSARLAWSLPESESLSSEVARLSGEGTPFSFAEEAAAGIIATGGSLIASPEFLGRLLAGTNAVVVQADPRRR